MMEGGGGRASANVRGSVGAGESERRGGGGGRGGGAYGGASAGVEEGASGAVTHLVHVSLATKAGPHVTELHEGQHLRTEQRDFLGCLTLATSVSGTASKYQQFIARINGGVQSNDSHVEGFLEGDVYLRWVRASDFVALHTFSIPDLTNL